MKKILLVSAMLISSTFIYSQPPVSWHYTYDGTPNGTDELLAMTVDNSGNTLLAGITDTNFLDYAAILIKLDQGGNVMWQKYITLNGPDIEPYAMITDAAGNIYVTGTYDSPGNFGYDIFTIKYDASGNQLWVQYFNGTANDADEPSAIAFDNAGNVLITGKTTGTGTVSDLLVLKYSASGNPHWSSSFNNTAFNWLEQGVALDVDASDNIYVCGYTYILANTNRDFLTLKMDSSGSVQWYRTYDDSLQLGDECVDIEVDVAGDIVVTGSSYGWGPGYPVYEFATIKYDAAGTQQWVRRYESANSTATPADMLTDAAGNIYITGAMYDDTTKFDAATIKYDTNGNMLWLKLVNGPINYGDYGSRILQDAAGNIYVAGTINNVLAQNEDGLLVIYEPGGNILYQTSYDDVTGGENYFEFMELDNAGNIITAGEEYANTNEDFLAVKYSSVIGMQEVFSDNDLAVYPNPADQSVVIVQESLENSELKIFDVMGKEIYQSIVIGHQSLIDVSKFENGIYFVQVSSANKTAAQKLIIHH